MENEIAKKSTATAGAVIKKERSIASMLSNSDSAWGKELLKVLPNDKEVARFMALALNQLADPKVGAKLAACSLPSFYNAIMKSARLGIMPDGVNAYLIPYGKECTLQASYRGLCDMAIREKIATRFVADIVRANDVFKWSNGELVEHTPSGWTEEERGDIVGVWVRAFLPGGEHIDCRMSVSDIEKIKSKSQNPNGVWREWYEEMAKKSCLKRLFKTMQNTPSLAEAIAEDNKEYNLEQERFNRQNRISADEILSQVDAQPKSDKPEAEVIEI